MNKRVETPFFYPPGHFYSPLGDRSEVSEYLSSDHYARQIDHTDRLIDFEAQSWLWDRISPLQVKFPFEEQKGFRYYARNNQFTYFDASILSGILNILDPGRIVEIGSGFSTAAMFDTFERMSNPSIEQLTTIDIDMSRLDELNPPDYCERINAPVQSIDPAYFAQLGEGDLLFIDTSHVMKTGSDVHYEYLHILPALKPGVVVHIHDIHYPFEYCRQWAKSENRSWNEVYLVDMLLTYSKDFKMLFFNDAFKQCLADDLREPGDMFDRFEAFSAKRFHSLCGSLWLVKTG